MMEKGKKWKENVRWGERDGRAATTTTHHAAGVVAKGDAARVHHPVVGVTYTVDGEAGGLGPGC